MLMIFGFSVAHLSRKKRPNPREIKGGHGFQKPVSFTRICRIFERINAK
jgi:hypothetical protein